MWENYGRILAEYVFIKKFRNSELKDFITIDGEEIFLKIKKKITSNFHLWSFK